MPGCAKACEGSEVPSLLALNDDCLAHIFSKLKLQDKINLARCATRLQRIFWYNYKRKFRKFELGQYKRITRKIPELFNVAGPLMEILVGRDLPQTKTMFSAISQHCSNVRVIYLRATILEKAGFRDMLESLKHVRELRLRACNLTDEDALMLDKLDRLEVLDLSLNNDITGKHICKLSQLKELYLFYTGLCEIHLMDICKKVQQLRILDIRYCDAVKQTYFLDIDKYCLNLEYIKVYFPSEGAYEKFECVARLPQLRGLEVCGHAGSIVRFFSHLLPFVDHKSGQLECLVVDKWYLSEEYVRLMLLFKQLKRLELKDCHFIVDVLSGFAALENLEEILIKHPMPVDSLNLLRTCHKLRHIGLYNCFRNDNEFFFEVIALLLWRREEFRFTMELSVIKTDINENMLKDPRFISAKKLIRFTMLDTTEYDPH